MAKKKRPRRESIIVADRVAMKWSTFDQRWEWGTFMDGESMGQGVWEGKIFSDKQLAEALQMVARRHGNLRIRKGDVEIVEKAYEAEWVRPFSQSEKMKEIK